MAVGNVVRYHQLASLLGKNGRYDWDDPTAGAFMWVLVNNGYNPSSSITGTQVYGTIHAFAVTSGGGAPVNVTSRLIQDSTTQVAQVNLISDSANLGVVTPAVKYLICVQTDSVTPGVLNNNALLCFYVDLDTTSNVAQLAPGATVNVIATNNIWGTLG